MHLKDDILHGWIHVSVSSCEQWKQFKKSEYIGNENRVQSHCGYAQDSFSYTTNTNILLYILYNTIQHVVLMSDWCWRIWQLLGLTTLGSISSCTVVVVVSATEGATQGSYSLLQPVFAQGRRQSWPPSAACSSCSCPPTTAPIMKTADAPTVSKRSQFHFYSVIYCQIEHLDNDFHY